MKVYTAFNHTYTKIFSTKENAITYTKIFSSKEKAIDSIIKQWLIESDFYLGIKREALVECAGKLVIEHEVE